MYQIQSYKIPAIALAVAAVGTTALAYDGFSFGHDGWQRYRHSEQMQFALGICVGQTLAQQGITLPTPQPDEPPPPLDSTTQEALQTATQSCQAEFHGTSPTPGPSATPSSSPTSTPSSTPVAAPTPTPTGSPTATPTSTPTPDPSGDPSTDPTTNSD